MKKCFKFLVTFLKTVHLLIKKESFELKMFFISNIIFMFTLKIDAVESNF